MYMHTTMKSLSIMLNEAFEFNDSVNSLPYSGAVKKEILTKCSPTDEVTQILVNTVLPKIYDIISGMKFAKELEFNIINSKTFKIFQYSTSQIGMQFDKISQSGFELDLDEMYKKLNAYLSSNKIPWHVYTDYSCSGTYPKSGEKITPKIVLLKGLLNKY